MRLGYNQPLYLLPFDHRHSYRTGIFHFTAPLTADQREAVTDSKRLVYDGFKQTLPGFIGFAVGRTTLWNAVAGYVAKQLTGQEAASLVARRSGEWAAVFERAHAHAGAA